LTSLFYEAFSANPLLGILHKTLLKASGFWSFPAALNIRYLLLQAGDIKSPLQMLGAATRILTLFI
jgi:hypothetical protein